MIKPKFIVIGGSIGSGKTNLAYGLKQHLPDVVIIENDTVRRELLGFPLDYFMNHEVDNSFSDENNERVRAEMNRRIQDAFLQGKSVIEAPTRTMSFLYKMYEGIYPDRVDFKGIFLYAPEEVIRQRLRKRALERATLSELSLEEGHASDADEAVLLKMPVNNEIPENWFGIDTTQPKYEVLQLAIDYINYS